MYANILFYSILFCVEICSRGATWTEKYLDDKLLLCLKDDFIGYEEKL